MTNTCTTEEGADKEEKVGFLFEVLQLMFPIESSSWNTALNLVAEGVQALAISINKHINSEVPEVMNKTHRANP